MTMIHTAKNNIQTIIKPTKKEGIVKKISARPAKVDVTVMGRNGSQLFLSFPATRVVCHRCNGTGVHDHPAFSNGITSDELHEDPDFAPAYFSGRYDVTCEECDGARIMDVVDEDFVAGLESSHPRIFAAYFRQMDQLAADAQESAMERRMGC